METQLVFLGHYKNCIYRSDENNTPIKIYVRKWKQITHELKDEYLPELLILVPWKLLKSTESKDKRQKWRKRPKIESCGSCFSPL